MAIKCEKRKWWTYLRFAPPKTERSVEACSFEARMMWRTFASFVSSPLPLFFQFYMFSLY